MYDLIIERGENAFKHLPKLRELAFNSGNLGLRSIYDSFGRFKDQPGARPWTLMALKHIDSGAFEQVIMLKTFDVGTFKPVPVLAEILIAKNGNSALKTEMLDTVCAICSTEYIDCPDKPVLGLELKFNTEDAQQVCDALKTCRLAKYEMLRTFESRPNPLPNQSTLLTLHINYWK